MRFTAFEEEFEAQSRDKLNFVLLSEVIFTSDKSWMNIGVLFNIHTCIRVPAPLAPDNPAGNR